jgi:hypothetical protein
MPVIERQRNHIAVGPAVADELKAFIKADNLEASAQPLQPLLELSGCLSGSFLIELVKRSRQDVMEVDYVHRPRLW